MRFFVTIGKESLQFLLVSGNFKQSHLNFSGAQIPQEEAYFDSACSTDSPSYYGQNSSPINSQYGTSSPQFPSSQYITTYCTPEEYEKNSEYPYARKGITRNKNFPS